MGTTFLFPLADYNTLSLSLDLNKLLVPAAPRQEDYLDVEGNEDREAYEAAKEKYQSTSPISGIFKSFSDAPGGFALKVLRLDAAYVVATAQSSPLDQTLRFSLSFDMDGIKDLVGRRRR